MHLLDLSAVTHAAQAQTQASSGSNSSSSSSPGSLNSLTSENTFLQLLVAQIKNQNPTNPADSIQFVGQLVQYSELEQLMGINQGIQNLTSATTPPAHTTSHSS